MSNKQNIGGQAVMEGVMMRNRNRMAIACRDPEGGIKVIQQKLLPLADRYPVLGLFFIRGIIVFFESMLWGVRALNISTEQVLEAEGEEITPAFTILSVLLGLVFAILLFFFLPTYLMRFLPQALPVLQERYVILNLLEGILRIFIFVSYIWAISRWSEIKVFFAYHGAEHKAINCFEAGEELEPENAGKYSVQHPRCGTSYLLIVMTVSILLFSFFGWPTLWQRFLIRLTLLPVVAGLAYEFIRWTANSRSGIVKYLAYPGLMLQKLTTREPEPQQVEVALASLKSLLDTNMDANLETSPEASEAGNADAVGSLGTGSIPGKEGDTCAGETG